MLMMGRDVAFLLPLPVQEKKRKSVLFDDLQLQQPVEGLELAGTIHSETVASERQANVHSEPSFQVQDRKEVQVSRSRDLREAIQGQEEENTTRGQNEKSQKGSGEQARNTI